MNYIINHHHGRLILFFSLQPFVDRRYSVVLGVYFFACPRHPGLVGVTDGASTTNNAENAAKVESRTDRF
jgi:hypothetical protein